MNWLERRWQAKLIGQDLMDRQRLAELNPKNWKSVNNTEQRWPEDIDLAIDNLQASVAREAKGGRR